MLSGTGPKNFSNAQLLVADLSISPATRKLLRRVRKALSTSYSTGLEGRAFGIIDKWTVQAEDAARSKVPVFTTQLRNEMFRSDFDGQGHGKVYVVSSQHTNSWGPNKPGSAQLARFLDAVAQRRSRTSEPQFGFSPASNQFSQDWIAEAMSEFESKKAVWK